MSQAVKDTRPLSWKGSTGGAMGGNELLMLGGSYVGHFYQDASDDVDVDGVLAAVVHRYNSHEALIAALNAAEMTLDGAGYHHAASLCRVAVLEAEPAQ